MNIFSIEYFEEEISLKLDVNHKDWVTFKDNFDNVLKEHVPKKIKTTCIQYFEVNIMKHSHLKKRVNKTSLPSDKQNYKKKTKKFSP